MERQLPELSPEALDDLCRYLEEYRWNPAFAVRLLRRRRGIALDPLDAEYLCAVELRRRAYE